MRKRSRGLSVVVVVLVLLLLLQLAAHTGRDAHLLRLLEDPHLSLFQGIRPTRCQRSRRLHRVLLLPRQFRKGMKVICLLLHKGN